MFELYLLLILDCGRQNIVVFIEMKELMYFFVSPEGYPMPAGYPAGKGTGTKFYPHPLKGKGTTLMRGYGRGRAFALPAPYPTRCHPYSRSTPSLFGLEKKSYYRA